MAKKYLVLTSPIKEIGNVFAGVHGLSADAWNDREGRAKWEITSYSEEKISKLKNDIQNRILNFSIEDENSR